ncbi:DUF1648 domain-containing protein [Oceanithermus sp.]
MWLVVLPFYLAPPDLVPAHLNAAGEVNRWGSKLEALALPLIFTFVVRATLPILLVAPSNGARRRSAASPSLPQ